MHPFGEPLVVLSIRVAQVLIESEELQQAISDLQTKNETLQRFFTDAEKRQEKDKMVRRMVSEVKDLIFEAREMTEKHMDRIQRRRQQRCGNLLSCIYYALKLQKEAADIRSLVEKVSRIDSKMKAYGLESRQESSSTPVTTNANPVQGSSSAEGETVILVFEEDIKTIVQQLLNVESRKVIGVCGANGLGKTTLVKEVLKQEIIKEHFNATVWAFCGKRRSMDGQDESFATAPESEDELFLQKFLINLEANVDAQRRREISLLQESDLIQRISQILNAKRCLVVIDDFQPPWCNTVWRVLDSCCNQDSPSKFVLTISDAVMLRSVGHPQWFLHQPRCLDSEDKWKLFQATTATIGRIKGSIIRAKGKSIIEKCVGLPLAIHVLGGILTHDTEYVTAVATKLIMKILNDDLRNCYIKEEVWVKDVLEWSYAFLPRRLRLCLSIMSSHSLEEGNEIPESNLINFWAGGIFQHKKQPEKVAKTCLDKLVKRNLIQVVAKEDPTGEIKTCLLHSLVREFYLSESGRGGSWMRIVKRLEFYTTLHFRRRFI